MKRTRGSLALLLTTVGAGSALGAVAPAEAATNALTVRSIVVSPRFSHDHTVFASAAETQCPSCADLLRSRDGGQTWQRVAAHGFVGGDLTVTTAGSRIVLVSASSSSVRVSLDDGNTWRTVHSSGGIASTAPWSSRADLFIGGNDPVVVPLPSGPQRKAPALGLQDPYYLPVTDSRGTASAVVVVGFDQSARQPALAACSAGWKCARPHVISTRGYEAVVTLSPAFGTDHLAYAIVGEGQPARSVNGGTTFVDDPVPAFPGPGTSLTLGASAVDFSPDFNARTGRGFLLANAYNARTSGTGSARKMTAYSGFAVRAAADTSWHYLSGAMWTNAVVTATALGPGNRVFYAPSTAPSTAPVQCGVVHAGALVPCSGAVQTPRSSTGSGPAPAPGSNARHAGTGTARTGQHHGGSHPRTGSRQPAGRTASGSGAHVSTTATADASATSAHRTSYWPWAALGVALLAAIAGAAGLHRRRSRPRGA